LTDQESFNELFKTEQTDKSIFEEFEETPDAEKISKSIKDGKQTDEIQKFRKNLVTVLDQAAHSFKNLSREEIEEEGDKEEEDQAQIEDVSEEVAEEQDTESEVNDEPEDEIDVLKELSDPDDSEEKKTDESDDAESGDEPMWRQFLRPDQMDVLMGGGKPESDEELLIDEEALFEEDPEDDNEQTVPQLSDFLLGQEKLFINKVFGGKKKKYKSALKSIVEFDEWDKAADFLQEEVFGKNDVDMLSDPAVDFTDKLQSYFDEYKTNK
jgi:hypothetical protein